MKHRNKKRIISIMTMGNQNRFSMILWASFICQFTLFQFWIPAFAGMTIKK